MRSVICHSSNGLYICEADKTWPVILFDLANTLIIGLLVEHHTYWHNGRLRIVAHGSASLQPTQMLLDSLLGIVTESEMRIRREVFCAVDSKSCIRKSINHEPKKRLLSRT